MAFERGRLNSPIARKAILCAALLVVLLAASAAFASEAELKVPDLSSQQFVGVAGSTLLWVGMLICLLGMVFGLVQFMQIRALPVHKAMLEISELIYETCKTYLIQQGKFLAMLWAFIAAIMVVYFGFLKEGFSAIQVVIIIIFSIVGILGSYSVAWFGIRINTLPTRGRRSPASKASRIRRWRSR